VSLELKIFGRDTEEVAERCRKQHNEGHHNSHSSSNFIRVTRWRKIWGTINTDGRPKNLMQNFGYNAEV
jgi:hypothetical protein